MKNILKINICILIYPESLEKMSAVTTCLDLGPKCVVYYLKIEFECRLWWENVHYFTSMFYVHLLFISMLLHTNGGDFDRFSPKKNANGNGGFLYS
jgi:hypothetical protein